MEDEGDDGNSLYSAQLEKMTKIVTLLGELRALKDEDKDARAIVFTQFDDVQKRVVRALSGIGWDVFEFNQPTAPTRRPRACSRCFCPTKTEQDVRNKKE